MSQMQPITADEGVPGELIPLDLPVQERDSKGRRVTVPLWLRLLLGNPKSRFGLIVIAIMILVGVFAPWIATHDPNAYSLLDAKQSPSLDHYFGTTDQGNDIFSQVVWGTRTSLFLGAAAAVIATALAATLGVLGAYSGGWVDDARQLHDERLPGDPDDPAAGRRLGLPQEPRLDVDDPDPRAHPVGVRGARPARPGALVAQPRLHPRRQGRRASRAGASSSSSSCRT